MSGKSVLTIAMGQGLEIVGDSRDREMGGMSTSNREIENAAGKEK